MKDLDFLSPGRARAGDGFEPGPASPLRRVLGGRNDVRDLSAMGKIEVRGDIESIDDEGVEIVRISPRRALVLCDAAETSAVLARLPGLAIDMTGALTGLEFESERALRRLTDLDPAALPAVGKVADVPCVALRDGDSFRLFVAQEYGHYVAEVLLDALDGLA